MSQEPSYAAMLSVRPKDSTPLPTLCSNLEQPDNSLDQNLCEVLDMPLPSGEKGALLAEFIQEEALDILRQRLNEAGIALDQRIVFTLNANGDIHTAEHPAHKQLEELVCQEPLPHLFRQIAAIALTGRGLDDLRAARDLLNNPTGAEPLLQACLKGALSHFHLVKNRI